MDSCEVFTLSFICHKAKVLEKTGNASLVTFTHSHPSLVTKVQVAKIRRRKTMAKFVGLCKCLANLDSLLGEISLVIFLSAVTPSIRYLTNKMKYDKQGVASGVFRMSGCHTHLPRRW